MKTVKIFKEREVMFMPGPGGGPHGGGFGGPHGGGPRGGGFGGPHGGGFGGPGMGRPPHHYGGGYRPPHHRGGCGCGGCLGFVMCMVTAIVALLMLIF